MRKIAIPIAFMRAPMFRRMLTLGAGSWVAGLASQFEIWIRRASVQGAWLVQEAYSGGRAKLTGARNVVEAFARLFPLVCPHSCKEPNVRICCLRSRR
jgi:hypothetical protein